jgi:hypothetical protein
VLDLIGMPNVRFAVLIVCGSILLLVFAGQMVQSQRLIHRQRNTVIAVLFAPLVFQFVVVFGPAHLPFWGVRHVVMSVIGIPVILGLLAERMASAGVKKQFVAYAALSTLLAANVVTLFLNRDTAMREAANRLATLGRGTTVAASDLYNVASPLSWYRDHRCVDDRLLNAQLLNRKVQGVSGYCQVGSELPVAATLLVVHWRDDGENDPLLVAARHRFGQPGITWFQSSDQSLSITQFSTVLPTQAFSPPAATSDLAR